MAYNSEEFKEGIADEVVNKILAMQEDTMEKPNPDLLGTNENVKLIETILDEGFNEQVKKKSIVANFWAVNSKAVKLTNVENKDDLSDFKNSFDVSKISFIMAQSSQDFSFADMLDLDQMELNFDFSLRRSMGIPQGKITERVMIGTQIQQKISSHTEGMRNLQGYGGGWINKVKGFFG